MTNSNEVKEIRRYLKQMFGQIQQLERTIAFLSHPDLDARMQEVESALREKASIRQFKALDIALMGLASRVPAIEQVQKQDVAITKLKASLNTVQDLGVLGKIPRLLQSVHEIEEQMHRYEESFVSMQVQMQEKMTTCEHFCRSNFERIKALEHTCEGEKHVSESVQNAMLALKASVSDIDSGHRISQRKLEELEEKLAGAAAKTQVDSFETRLSQAENSLAAASKNFQAIDLAMSLKAAVDQVKAVEGDTKKVSNDLRDGLEKLMQHEKVVKAAENKLGELECFIQDKLGNRQLEDLRESLSGLQNEVIDVREGLKEKVCTTKLNSAAMGIQIQLTQIENVMQQKVDIERIQQLSNIASNFDMKVNALEQALQSGANNVHRIEGKLSHLQEQVVEIRNTKAGTRDVQAIGGSITSVEVKVRGIENDLQSRANRMHAVEDTIRQLEGEVKELAANMRSGIAKIPHFESHITNIKAQLASLEQASQSKVEAHNLHQVEKSLSHVKEDLVNLQHGVQQGALRLQSREVRTTETESFQFQRSSLGGFTPSDRHNRGGSTRASAVNHRADEQFSLHSRHEQGEASSRSPRMGFKQA